MKLVMFTTSYKVIHVTQRRTLEHGYKE